MVESDTQNTPHTLLQERLWNHPFEHPHRSMDLVRRLCIEQHWTPAQAREATEEYRRFCFLACTAGHPVTPSDQVDVVWHLHLLHTRDYWEVFCPQVLGRPLHHGPTEGGASQEHLFYEQYSRTLASYSQVFGPPPETWWPPARQRFEPMNRWRWIYLPHHLVLPNPLAWCKRQGHRLLQHITPKRIRL
jgi:hypothetical protein